MTESKDLEKINVSQSFVPLTTQDDFHLILNPTENIQNLTVLEAIKEISLIAFPTMLFFLCLFCQQSINLIFIGHFYSDSEKNDAIDGIGISHLYINCTLLSIVVGLISGFETLGSNAYGAKKYYLLGLYFHRALLISYLFTILVLTFHFFFAVKVLSLFSIDENVLFYISKYIKISMFFILFDVLFSVNFRYLNIIEKSYINLIILFISLCLHPLWCYIFITLLEIGVEGAALSLIISQGLNSMLGLIYILTFRFYPQSIFCFNKDSFKGWWEYLKIALPSAFLLCAEWWAFEVLAIVAIWISKLDYTVHILISNISGLYLTITLGFGMATVIIIGKNISMGNTHLVKKYSKVLLIFGASIQFTFSLILLIFRREIIEWFIDEEDVIEKGSTVLLIIPIINMLDYTQGIFNSICRGLGLQIIASLIAFGNFYIVQTTLGIIFGKVWGYGVFGIWSGVLIGCSLSGVLYSIALSRYDLETIKRDTLKRLEFDMKLNSEEITSNYTETTHDLLYS